MPKTLIRTNYELFLVHALHSCVRLGDHEHVPNAFAGTLLAERHLQDGRVNWLARNLPANLIELSVRDFEVRRRVFVLEHSTSVNS